MVEVERWATDHRKLHSAATKIVAPELLQSTRQLDWDFHDRIIDAMENTIISDIHRINAIKNRLIRNTETRMLPELVVSVLAEHLAVLAALRQRDSSKAVTAIHTHITSAK